VEACCDTHHTPPPSCTAIAATRAIGSLTFSTIALLTI
jgi:hypothetical protein